MNLLWTIDDYYVDIFKICLKSIIRFPSPDGYHIYILYDNLSIQNQKDIKESFDHQNVDFSFICVPQHLFKDFPTSERYPITMYYRLLAAKLLPQNLDKILYLDPDMIVINPLDELYQMKFKDKDIIACTHVRKVLNKINLIRLGVDIRKAYPYINTGMMLMNLNALRTHIDENKIIDYVNHYQKRLTLPDQDIITALYGDRIQIVDYVKYNLSDRMLAFYNASFQHHIDIEWIKQNTVIIHYCGKNKPWNDHYVGILDVFFHEIK